MKKLLLLLLCAFAAGSIYAQAVDDMVEKIDIKLSKDKSYLNLNYINFQPDDKTDPILKLVPRSGKRKPFIMKENENIYYRIVFLKEGYDLDSIYLLYLEEIRIGGGDTERLFASADASSTDTVKVLDFKDVYSLRYNHREHYSRLYKLVENYMAENNEVSIPSLLAINPDREIKTELGISSRDNRDYLNFVNVNGMHYYPGGQTSAVQNSRRKTEVKLPYRFDISFSSISFSHELMDFSLGNSSVELNVTEKVLNVLPWQTSTLNAGLRTLLAFSENTSNITEATYVDAKLMARFKVNTNKIFENQPFIYSDAARLNLSTALIGDISLTRPFSLPFINLYFATGERDFSNPFITKKEGANKTAYFSFAQAEGSMSFYWNSNDKYTNRFRLDVGGAFHDVWKANYSSSDSLLNYTQIHHKVQPAISFHYNFVPNNNPLLGGKLRFYDSQLSLNAWVKILELNPQSTLRFETSYLFSPYARKQHAWETDGGYMFQFRYRYGL
jgi:hypothetical protein